MRHSLFFSLPLAILVACGGDNTAEQKTVAPPPSGTQSASSAGSAGDASMSGGEMGAMQGANSNVLMDMGEVKAQKTQDEIKGGDAVTVSGTVTGTCSGAIRIDAIEINAPPPAGGEPAGPVTSTTLEAAGAFTMLVPKGSALSLSALCDNNADGKIEIGSDLLSDIQNLDTLNEDKSGVTLKLDSIQAMGGGGMGGPGSGGMSQGGMSQGGMSQGGMGQPMNSMSGGMSQGGMGQPMNSMSGGMSQGGMSQGGMGQPMNNMSQGGMGQPMNNMSQGGMGQPSTPPTQ